MQPYVRVTGFAAPLDRADVDTDQIIPAVHLKRIERTGLGPFLFERWRFRPDGNPDPDFVLNQPHYHGASILVTGRNFGCGSSREHAAWALRDYGFRTIIAPSFADIFRSNCYQNGILPVVLSPDIVDHLMARASAPAVTGYALTVDLERSTLSDDAGLAVGFEVEPFHRDCLLRGLDAIDRTLEHEAAIAAYEGSSVC